MHGWGQDHLSQGLDWGGTVSLGWDHLTWIPSDLIQDISFCAFTLRAGSRSAHMTRSIGISIFLPNLPPSSLC